MLAASGRCIGGIQLGKVTIGEAPSPAQGPSLSSASSEIPRRAAPGEEPTTAHSQEAQAERSSSHRLTNSPKMDLVAPPWGKTRHQ